VEAGGLRVKTGSLAASSSPLTAAPTLWGLSDLALDTAATRLQIAVAKNGAPLEQLLPPAGLAVVNGGYFEPNFRPSTWLKDAGVELSRKSDTSKGGVLAVGRDGIFIGPFARLSGEPSFALQSFPLIIEADGTLGIHTDDGRRAARSVVCLVDGALHFIIIAAPRGDGPTLFETAALLHAPPPNGFGCRVALNLDGGPSSGVWFGPRLAAKQRRPLAPVAYAVAIMPR
jgi:hypothetical protein